MAQAIDLTGQSFGYLYVIERDFQEQKKHPNERQAWWKCQCNNCGNIKSIRGSSLRRGTKTCGCVSKETCKKISQRLKNSQKFKASMKQLGERTRENLVGKRFSRLVVIQYAEQQYQKYYNGKHRTTWKCQCDCGNICYVTAECLKKGDTPSCGCITKQNGHKTLKDLSGQRFGHLTAIKYLGCVNHNSKYLVRCDCGKQYVISASNLRSKDAQSCGCIRRSKGEDKIAEILKQNNIIFETQKSFDGFRFPTNGIPKYDFFIPSKNILIQYDGQQHFRPISWSAIQNKEEIFKKRVQYDQIKTNWALDNGYILIRIPYTHYDFISLKDLLEKSDYIIERR